MEAIISFSVSLTLWIFWEIPRIWELHCGEISAGSRLNAVYSHRSGSMQNVHVCFPVHAHLHESGSFYDFLVV